jgi:hypothetical protein
MVDLFLVRWLPLYRFLTVLETFFEERFIMQLCF